MKIKKIRRHLECLKNQTDNLREVTAGCATLSGLAFHVGQIQAELMDIWWDLDDLIDD